MDSGLCEMWSCVGRVVREKWRLAKAMLQTHGVIGQADQGLVYLSTKQAATLCKVTPERMRTLAMDGRVPSEFVKHQYQFSAAELQDILEKSPEVIYSRRTPLVVQTVALRESRRANMLRLNATQDRRAVAQKGLDGLLRKIAREHNMDPDNLTLAERENLQMLYRAYMATVRSKKAESRKLTTREQRVASLLGEVENAEAQTPSRPMRALATATATATALNSEALSICYRCWREKFGGRPPAGLANKLCAEHERAHAAEVAAMREYDDEMPEAS